MEHWYDNEISRGILAAKYYHEGETTPQQFIDRVSSINNILNLRGIFVNV